MARASDALRGPRFVETSAGGFCSGRGHGHGVMAEPHSSSCLLR